MPADLKNLDVEPGTTTALITWQTDAAATTRVDYGATTNYGSTTLNSRLVKSHIATLSGLMQGSNYYFRAISATGALQYNQACQFSTLASLTTTQVFGITNVWRYATNNLNGINWQARTYNDTNSNWIGQGRGLLYVENSGSVQPKNTALPPAYGQTIAPTYYFRTHFNFTGSASGASLILSNYVDDGAVFYLNGTEVYRLRMAAAPTAITYTTAATGQPGVPPTQGDATTNAPDVFTLSGNALTNLVQGDNVLAVEVHQVGSLASGDIVFGSALILNRPLITSPRLYLQTEAGVTALYWNSDAFTLQQSSDLSSPANWSNTPGPVTQSPFTVTNPVTTFFRLKN